jgi:hypothetical protein
MDMAIEIALPCSLQRYHTDISSIERLTTRRECGTYFELHSHCLRNGQLQSNWRRTSLEDTVWLAIQQNLKGSFDEPPSRVMLFERALESCAVDMHDANNKT